jgi:UDP-2,3-diacylglucosamine pyrophosphatase LpxH
MQTLYVISDLHLGGDSSYSIFPARGQALLSDFIEDLTQKASSGEDIHLIVNGDSVDFLAETEFRAFTADDAEAEAKLDSIIKSTRDVWDGFAKFVRDGGELTFTIGNHDIELALPGPRRLLAEKLGAGRVI